MKDYTSARVIPGCLLGIPDRSTTVAIFTEACARSADLSGSLARLPGVCIQVIQAGLQQQEILCADKSILSWGKLFRSNHPSFELAGQFLVSVTIQAKNVNEPWQRNPSPPPVNPGAH